MRYVVSSFSMLNIWLCFSLCMVIGFAVSQSLSRLISPELLTMAEGMYGTGIEPRLLQWGELVTSSQDLSEKQKLKEINQYFNDRIVFISDDGHWEREDYWATPLESLGTEGGDCEDYVIAKYFSLIQAGIDQSKLRITYVKALKLNQAHMVLAYYDKPSSEPLILDNLTDRILPASKRRDLSPVYSFNGLGMWLERMKGGSIKVGDPKRLNMWMDLLLRMKELKMEPWIQVP